MPDSHDKEFNPDLFEANMSSANHKSRIILLENQDYGDGEESQNVWGFTDTEYRATKDGEVEITGKRYATSGQRLPKLLPWISDLMEVDIPRGQKLPSSLTTATLPDARENERFLKSICLFMVDTQISLDPLQRLRCGHGHSLQDIHQINYDFISIKRMPDVVLYPSDAKQVLAIVDTARKCNVCLLPYGGGTNVSQALTCPETEERMIAAVSMKGLNKVLWIDKESRMARIEAGAVGRHIVTTLAKYDMMLGHEPDSVEFSTLGGWIATKASGMKKNRYGNIEDIVLDIDMATPNGIVSRSSDNTPPREAVGIDIRSWAFGSEGSLGIIISAVVKIFPLPKVQHYGSVLFKSFDKGLAFMHELAQSEQLPASVRLVDNTQFQFSMALKSPSTGIRAMKSTLERFYVMRIKSFEPNNMVACTLVFEGHAKEVKAQEATLYGLAKSHGGLKAGAGNGKRGYEMTFAIAYIRDFALSINILAESFETSCSWSAAAELCRSVRARVQEQHKALAVPGKPFLSSRISQVYDTGVTVYFYLAIFVEGLENPVKVYSSLEESARDEILRCGGSLSHHHGIGTLRHKYLDRVLSPAAISYRSRLQKCIDSDGVFLPGQVLASMTE